MKKIFAAAIFSIIFVALASFSAFASVLLYSSSITGPISVNDSSNNLFYKEFKFDIGLDIEYFELNLAYSNVNNGNMQWYVTPFMGDDVKIYANYPYALTPNGSGQPFTFTSEFLGKYFDLFKNNGYFTLGFYETTSGPDKFNLTSATLDVYGTPPAVPIPGAAMLLGPVLLGLVAFRRKHAA